MLDVQKIHGEGFRTICAILNVLIKRFRCQDTQMRCTPIPGAPGIFENLIMLPVRGENSDGAEADKTQLAIV